MRKAKKARRGARAAVGGLDTGLAQLLGETLRARGMTLVTAESCTGGGVAQAITAISGCSEWFDRGFVTYSNVSKEEMLGVSPETLEQHGAVSEAAVREMVAGALQYSRARVALSVSGIAGPTGGTPEKPVGTVWFAWASGRTVNTACHQFAGDRDAIRVKAVGVALQGALDLVKQIA